MGTDGGSYGIELQYDKELKGTAGKYVVAKDANGSNMPFKYESYIDAKNGTNLVTTIDIKIQNVLEKQLALTLEESKANARVTGIVMNPNTGEVYGMATAPGYDLNSPSVLNDWYTEKLSEYTEGTDEYNDKRYGYLLEMWNNKAITELYEPGSTFKIITTAMALEEKEVKVNESFFCSGSLMVEGYGKPIKCHKVGGHGRVSFAEGLQQSCNPILMTIAGRLGPETFYSYFEAFGYTGKTGIDLPGESGQYFHKLSNFHNVELAVYSFGQTFKVTPIQQLTAICAVANGGYLVTPKIVKEYVDETQNTVEVIETEEKKQIVSSETCETLINILEEGVSGNGGAKNAYVMGYKVAAKTGTSEKRDVLDEAGNSYLRVGSCVGFAPADDPQVAVLIMVDEPSGGSVYGSVVAAPYVSNVLAEVLPYLGIEPNYTEAELKKMDVSVVNYVGMPVADAKSNIESKGIKCTVEGSGDTVNYQIPQAGSQLSKNTGRVILYTGDSKPDSNVTVPSVLGMTASNANRTLVNSGLNIKITGALNYDMGTGAIVVTQYPEAGVKVEYGTVVTVEFRHFDGTAN